MQHYGTTKSTPFRYNWLLIQIFVHKNFEAMKNDLIKNNYPAHFIIKYFEYNKKRIQYQSQSVSRKEPIDLNKYLYCLIFKFLPRN